MDLQILKIGDKCTGCGACVSVCPRNALTLNYNEEGFYIPYLDQSACIGCGLCNKSCQAINPATVTDTDSRHIFMAKAADKSLVKASSSGGAFSLLADKIGKEGGVVYGARYDFENERLIQDSTLNCSLSDLRKSKYIESYTSDTFKRIGQNLQQGLKVLFTGTPCQTEGLIKYLETKKIGRDNLIIVRFVCHGVPSNQFFTQYKHLEEKRHKSKMTGFDFRPKTEGWRKSCWKMQFANGDIDQAPYSHYYYYYFFQKSNMLRRSCYSCKRVLNDNADLTLGDFWGVFKYNPQINEQEGISLIMAHNPKALEFLKTVMGFEYISSLPASAVEYISREIDDRHKLLPARDAIMTDVKKHGYIKTAKRYAHKEILITKAKARLRKTLGKILGK